MWISSPGRPQMYRRKILSRRQWKSRVGGSLPQGDKTRTEDHQACGHPSHPDEVLCPAKVSTEYRSRTQAGDCTIAHPKDPSRRYTPLVHYVRDSTSATGTDRISNHI